MEKNNIVTNWLNDHGDPEVEKLIEKNLAITEKVRQALELKGWNKVQLAEAMGKQPSEVSKWLSGTHNLNMKSIIKMEVALGIDLIHCEPIKEYEYVFLGVIETKEEIQERAGAFTPATEESVYSIAM